MPRRRRKAAPGQERGKKDAASRVNKIKIRRATLLSKCGCSTLLSKWGCSYQTEPGSRAQAAAVPRPLLQQDADGQVARPAEEGEHTKEKEAERVNINVVSARSCQALFGIFQDGPPDQQQSRKHTSDTMFLSEMAQGPNHLGPDRWSLGRECGINPEVQDSAFVIDSISPGFSLEVPAGVSSLPVP